MPNLPVRLCWLVASLTTPLTVVLAQVAPSPSGTASDPVVALSPFEVSASQDIGYVGQDTLAGSRLRTNLKDVAAAISPMTAEFLMDIAATDVISAMEYGMNARVETDDGRAAGPVADGYNDGIRAIRIRGLPGGSRAVNFFKALGEVDTYIADRIDLSRGPNSILYGFGSPAGLINIATKQAMTNKVAHSATLRFDSWGGARASVDANLPVLKNTAAIRAVLLHGRERSWRAAGHNNQDRAYVAGKWQLHRKTTLKADFESARSDRFVPRPFFGLDLTAVWDAAGRPLFNNFNPAAPPGTLGSPGFPFRDSGSTALPGVVERSGGDWVVVSDRFPYATNFRQLTVSEAPTPISNDFVRGRRNPEAVLEANWVSGLFTQRNYSVTLQHEFSRDLNAELGFSRQGMKTDTRNLATWNFFGVAADSNRYQPNGQLKPADQLYYYDVSPDHRTNFQDLRELRAVLSYEKNLRDWALLRMAALGEASTRKNRSDLMQQYWLNGPAITSRGAFNPTPENGANTAYRRFYLSDPSVLDQPGFALPGPRDLSGGVPYQDPATGAIRTIYLHEFNRSQGNIDYYDEDMRGYMGVAQAYLFKNRVVATAGYRQDKLEHFEAQAQRDPAAEASQPNTGVWRPVMPPSTPEAIYRGRTFTAGGVVHLTPWLSAFYNRSSSVNVPGGIRVFRSDPSLALGAALPPPREGETSDYGLKLSLLRRRLFVTATEFHTTVTNETGFSGFSARGTAASVWTSLIDSGALDATDADYARKQLETINQVQGYLLDSESKGYELEIVGELRPGWSLSVNYSKTKSVRSNIAREVRAYFDYHKPQWLRYRDFALNQNINVPGPERLPFENWNSPAQIAANGDFTANTDTINERIADAEAQFFDNPKVFENNRFIGDNLHNLNLRSRYDFRQGTLRGLSVGAGMRLRAGRVAGAKVSYDFLPNTSYTDAYNGRVINGVKIVNAVDQALYDLQLSYRTSLLQRKLGWTIQLNVNNLTDVDDLIVNNTHPVTLAPITYRYQDPRQFILTNTFSF